MTTSPELQSRVISLLRFPLMVLVVLIHSRLNGVDGGQAFQSTQFLLSDVLASVAVPFFFVISGYLFFYGKPFTWARYGDKLKRRARTLLVPYVLWILLFALLFFVVQNVLTSFSGGTNKHIAQYTAADWLRAFGIGAMPLDAPLWFLRDLMVTVVLSPIIYYGVRLLRWGWIALLAAVYFWGKFDYSNYGLSMVALFYFSCGATLSLSGRLLTNIPKKIFVPAAFLFLAMLIILGIDCLEDPWKLIAKKVAWLSEIIVMLWAVTRWAGKCPSLRPNKLLLGSTFFLYGFHAVPQQYIISLYQKGVSAMTTPHCFLLYFGNFIGVIMLSTACYWLCKRLLPRFASLLTGAR